MDTNIETKYLLKDSIQAVNNNKLALIKIPFFFKKSGNQLELFAAENDDYVFVSDNGAAFRELSLHTNDRYILNEMFNYLSLVFFGIKPSEKHEIIWRFSLPFSVREKRKFYDMLQCISLCANADLFIYIDEYEFQKHKERYNCISIPSDSKYPKDFIELIKSTLRQIDNKIYTRFTFDGDMVAMGILIESQHNNMITITSFGDKYDGGDLILRLEWVSGNNYHIFDELIIAVCKRFDANYDGENIRYTFVNDDKDSLLKAVFVFMQLMSILSRVNLLFNIN